MQEHTAGFNGATEQELQGHTASRRAAAVVDQRTLFPHDGTARLTDDRLVLGDWLELSPGDVRTVERKYTDAYSRFAAGRRPRRVSEPGLPRTDR